MNENTREIKVVEDQDNKDYELKWYDRAINWTQDHAMMTGAVLGSFITILAGCLIHAVIGGSAEDDSIDVDSTQDSFIVTETQEF